MVGHRSDKSKEGKAWRQLQLAYKVLEKMYEYNIRDSGQSGTKKPEISEP
jgi:hypothetical protein